MATAPQMLYRITVGDAGGGLGLHLMGAQIAIEGATGDHLWHLLQVAAAAVLLEDEFTAKYSPPEFYMSGRCAVLTLVPLNQENDGLAAAKRLLERAARGLLG